MSSSERTPGDPAAPGRSDAGTPSNGKPSSGKPPPPAATDPYESWMEKMQRGRGRHSAITRNLYNFASYKSWADKMKGSFEDGKK
jgi:hypothetical protein